MYIISCLDSNSDGTHSLLLNLMVRDSLVCDSPFKCAMIYPKNPPPHTHNTPSGSWQEMPQPKSRTERETGERGESRKD